jgi:hypothetical protein
MTGEPIVWRCLTAFERKKANDENPRATVQGIKQFPLKEVS